MADIYLEDLDPKIRRRQTRKTILNRYGGSCIYCNAPNAKTIDHVIPRADKANTSESAWNKFPCCANCNGSKSDANWREWYTQQAFFNLNSVAKIEEWVL